VQGRRKDGTVFSVDLAVSEVEPGKLFTGIIRDISDRKLAEARVREADRMASIGTLAAGLGHDMNNVLLPVRARLNALRAAGAAGRIPAAERKHLEDIRKSVAYLQQLADGLHFLAMDPEKQASEGGVTDLRVWWTQAGPLISKAAPKHVKVSASIPAGLPEIRVPAHGLTQAVLNLVVNAGDAIPPERTRPVGRLRISAEAVSVQGTHATVRLSVADNGNGMTEEVKRRAFELFFTTKPRGLGTGLGLALVRKVTEQAGGTVEVKSQLGKGTTMTMILPVASDARQRSTSEVGAVLLLNDGRAEGLLRHFLVAARVKIVGSVEPADAEILIVSPGAERLAIAKRWRKGRAYAYLVLFGRPSAGSQAAWKALRPHMIDDESDVDRIRSVISAAVAQCRSNSGESEHA